MESKIFISYRRGDDAGFAHALHAQLMQTFKTEHVFMDVQGHIEPGDSFSEVIDRHLGQAQVILVVIGNRWHEMIQDTPGRTDWVKYEIETALKMEKRLVPVLVDNADLPEPDDLPEEIRALCSFQTVELRPKRFAVDAGDLTAYLDRTLSEPTPVASPEQKSTLAVPIAAGIVLLIAVIGAAWYAGLIGGDYPSCIEAAEARWEEIRKCAVQHNFSL